MLLTIGVCRGSILQHGISLEPSPTPAPAKPVTRLSRAAPRSCNTKVDLNLMTASFREAAKLFTQIAAYEHYATNDEKYTAAFNVASQMVFLIGNPFGDDCSFKEYNEVFIAANGAANLCKVRANRMTDQTLDQTNAELTEFAARVGDKMFLPQG